jgi:hypothetical protein
VKTEIMSELKAKKIKLDESKFLFRNFMSYDQNEISILRDMYPEIAHWNDVSVMNAWLGYAGEVLLASSADPILEEEFIFYLLLKTIGFDEDLMCDPQTLQKEGSKYEVEWEGPNPSKNIDKIKEVVIAAMEHQWNGFVADTDSLPDDIILSNSGAKVSFTPGQWAQRVADDIAIQLTKKS